MLTFSVISARTRKTRRRREEKEGLPAFVLQFLLFSFAPSVSLWQLVLSNVNWNENAKVPGKRSLGIPCRFSQKDSRELSWNLEEANLTKKKEVRHWEQDSGHSLFLLPAPSMSGMLVIHRVTVSILVKFPQTVLPSPIYTSGERRRRHSTTAPMESRSIVPFDGFNWGRVRLGNLDLGFEIRILDLG